MAMCLQFFPVLNDTWFHDAEDDFALNQTDIDDDHDNHFKDISECMLQRSISPC